MDESQLPEEEKFSDDPEENIRMQNDFLKMKMMAESGAFFGGDGDLPSDIENEFLKNVMEFERASADAKPQKVFDLLGQPSFQDEKEMDDIQFATEFARLQKLLEAHNINVEWSAERPGRVVYDFITKELFAHETYFVPVKGMTTNFSYEEFHPDHKEEIAAITDNFLNDFFERKLSVDTDYIDEEIIEPDGNVLAKEQLISRFYAMYEIFIRFEKTSFNIENIDFELKDFGDGSAGMGFSEGEINYTAVLQGGEKKEIRGPFKIYFSRQWNYWSICFFYLAGYNLTAGSDN